MSSPTTVTLVLNNLGGKAGAIDGVINASLSANNNQTGATIAGTVTAVGSAAGMFPGKFPGPVGGFAVTMANLSKTGFDGSKLTIGDILTIGAGVAGLVGLPLVGFGLSVAGLGWTIYSLNNPKAGLTIEQLLDRLRLVPDDSKVEDIKKKTQTASRFASPIVLDLDGDGVIGTVGLGAGVFFDHAADGFAERTGWVAPGDGLLVWDRNANGAIDTGHELFGSETLLPNGLKAVNGFEALKAHDANGDGVIDANDPVFAELRVWVDADTNARTGEGELLTLEEAGVKSINLNYTNSTFVDAHGNAHKQAGSFVTTDGQTRAATDVWFQADATYSLPTEWVDVPEDIAALPDAQGYGKVRDLHQAMVTDASGQLKALVIAFTQADTPEDRMALVRQIIYRWTGVQDIDPTSRTNAGWGNAIGDARKLEALEEFLGEEWRQYSWGANPGRDAARTLNEAYDQLEALVYGQLISQSHQKDMFLQVSYRWDEETESIVGDLSAVAQTLAARIESDREAGLQDLGDFLYSLKGMGLLNRLDVASFKAALLPLGSDVAQTMDTALKGWVATHGPTEEDDVLRGTEFNDILDGRGGNDRLLGRGGDDTLIGGAGNDILDGGAGNDELRGGTGSDTYRFGRGDGHDIIIEDSWVASETDRIELKSGLTADDVRLSRGRTVSGWQVSDDLVLTIRDTGETLTVKKQFNESNRFAVEEIAFADGTVWDGEAIKSLVLLGEAEDETLLGFVERNDEIFGAGGHDALYGMSGDDRLFGGTGDDLLDGGAGNDRLEGGEGHDVLFGRDGDDVLEGGDGDDHLYGNEGDDILSGGAGNDMLDGGSGADTYHFGRGYGRDVVLENASHEMNGNLVVLDAGIRQEDIVVRKSGNDLILKLADTTDELVLRGAATYLSGSSFSSVRFADGTQWDYVTLQSRAMIGTAGDDRIEGFDAKIEVISGGAGNDTLIGGVGPDTYLFGRGDGHDVIFDRDTNAGNVDTLRFSAGVLASDVVLVRDGRDLAAHISDTGESITIKGFYQWEPGGWHQRIERMEFEDGTVWLSTDIESRAILAPQDYRLIGSAGPDVLTGNEQDNLIEGLDGADVLEGGAGNDTLIGGLDSDTLRGGDGDDVLYGLLHESSGDEEASILTPRAYYYLNEADNALIGDLSEAYPGFGEQYLGRNDDGSTGAIDITPVFGDQGLNFFGQSYTHIFINNNGNITFDWPLSSYTPSQIGAGSVPIIAPFWADVDTRGGTALVTPGGNSTGSNLVYYDLDVENGVLTVTWDDVGYYARRVDKVNAFQLQLVNRGGGDFDIVFRYEAINWTTGDASGGSGGLGGIPARAGYSAGDGVATHYFEMPESGDQTAMLNIDVTAGNTGRTGVHVFHVRNGLPKADNRRLIQQGDRGINFLFGGPGNDTYIVDTAGDVVTEFADEGIDIVRSSVDFVLPENVENLSLTGSRSISGTGNAQDNILVGNSAANILRGLEGDDTLDGGGGFDTLYGGPGNDTLRAGAQGGLLFGEECGDTYIYFAGDGEVVIDDAPQAGGQGRMSPNVLVFGEGIRLEDVRFAESAGDLLISFVGQPDDRVILRGYSSQRATRTNSVDIIRFADGREIVAFGVADNYGDDTLDVMTDTVPVVGGTGSDVYRIALDGIAPGAEFVIAETWRAQDFNRIELTGEINADDLRLEFDGRDLLLRLTEDGDAIRFAGFDPRAEGMQAPVSEISLPWQGVSLSFDDLLARGIRYGEHTQDIYVVNVGDGEILIDDIAAPDAGNILRFGAGIAPEAIRTRLSLEPDGNGGHVMLIPYGGEGDVVRLTGFNPDDVLGTRAVDRFEFANGTVWDYTTLVANGFSVFGDEESNDIGGSQFADRLYGRDGDDVIDGKSGINEFYGGRGNDTLIGGDHVDGYFFQRGDGVDTIMDGPSDNFIVFGPGVRKTDITVAWDGDTLVLRYGPGDEIRVPDFYAKTSNGTPPVTAIRFDDGEMASIPSLISASSTVQLEAGELPAATEDAVYRHSIALSNFNQPGAFGVARVLNLRQADGSPLPGWLTFDAERGLLRGTPVNENVGQLDLIVEAWGDYGLLATQRLRLSVNNTNDAPEVGTPLSNQRAVQNEPFSFTLPAGSFRDVDTGDVLTYAATLENGDPLPAWLRFDAQTGTFSGTPANGDVGELRLVVTATDLAGASVSQTFALEVADVNDAPVIGNLLAAQAVNEDAAFVYALPNDAFVEPDVGDRLSYSATLANGDPLPAWLSFDAASATFSGTPGNDDVGELQIRVTATDLAGASAAQTLSLTVANVNDAPEVGVSLTNQTGRVGQAVSWQLPEGAFFDVDAGDVLSYSASLADGGALPAWLSFDAATGTFSGTPASVGDYALRVTATDRAGAQASQTFTLAVEPGGNQAPITVPDMAHVIEDRKLFAWGNVLANDRDPEGERLRVADSGVRRGEYGVLTLLSNGTYAYVLDDCSSKVQGLGVGETVKETFNYLVSDGTQRSNGVLMVTVQGTNDTPDLVRCLTDVQLAKGKAFSWQLPTGSFKDADRNDTLAYTATLSNGKPLPSWLKFDAATQTFSGTAPANAKGSIDVRVTASDGHGECSTASDVFKISFGNKTVLPTATKGNEGVGNGQDAPPPGHAVNQNDGAGTAPGNPGNKGKKDDLLDRFLEGFKADPQAAAHKSSLGALDALDAGWFDRWLTPPTPAHGQTAPSGNGQAIEAHWQHLLQALNRLDAERQGAAQWLGKGQGADLSGLAGLLSSSNAMLRTHGDAVGLAAGAQLKGFAGLREGMSKLTC